MNLIEIVLHYAYKILDEVTVALYGLALGLVQSLGLQCYKNPLFSLSYNFFTSRYSALSNFIASLVVISNIR